MRPGPSDGVKEVGASASLSNSEGGDRHDSPAASLDMVSNTIDGDGDITGDGGTKQSGCSCFEKYRYYSYRWWNLSPTRARLSRGYNGLACQGVMVLLLLYTLFAPDIWVLASTPNEFDESLATSLFLCFVVFTLDVVFSSTTEVGYFGVSFFFWADVVGTLYVY